MRVLAQGIDKVATLSISGEIDKLATLSIPREIDKVASICLLIVETAAV